MPIKEIHMMAHGPEASYRVRNPDSEDSFKHGAIIEFKGGDCDEWCNAILVEPHCLEEIAYFFAEAARLAKEGEQ